MSSDAAHTVCAAARRSKDVNDATGVEHVQLLCGERHLESTGITYKSETSASKKLNINVFEEVIEILFPSPKTPTVQEKRS